MPGKSNAPPAQTPATPSPGPSQIDGPQDYDNDREKSRFAPGNSAKDVAGSPHVPSDSDPNDPSEIPLSWAVDPFWWARDMLPSSPKGPPGAPNSGGDFPIVNPNGGRTDGTLPSDGRVEVDFQ